ncbi:MAG: serine hydrolase domain-containing protein, partial [Pyrinomonadaceae bacterium]
MRIRKLSAAFLSLVTTISIFTVSLPLTGYAQTSNSLSPSDLESRLSSIESQLKEKQKELGIPGVSLAIVKDGKVILSKGFGYKNFEKKIPVTADTQFAIGSATKAFTGLATLISQDEGKLSLDDSPKKYIPYFKINDPDIDKNIQIRDLLCHSSGLNRTDLGWITGKLNEEEIIRVAGEAKPMAGLRKQFFYQNVMFLAAGEIVGSVQKMPWEKVIETKIFTPLGMKNSTTSVSQMRKAKDFSFGYEYNFDTKQTRYLPTREISAIAPAGSINSSSNDMAKWLQFILGGGEANGKQLVSKAGFDEWLKPQMKVTPNGSVSYGFGWFLQEWKGKKVVQH